MTSSNGNIFRVTGPLCGESAVNSSHKGQWRGALIFSLICAWTNGWVNNLDAGDLRRRRTNYDVTVIIRWYWYGCVPVLGQPNVIFSYNVHCSWLSKLFPFAGREGLFFFVLFCCFCCYFFATNRCFDDFLWAKSQKCCVIDIITYQSWDDLKPMWYLTMVTCSWYFFAANKYYDDVFVSWNTEILCTTVRCQTETT